MADTTLDTDVLIIGSGAGGSVIAHELANNRRDILMLEEGPHVTAANAATTTIGALQQTWRCGGLTTAMGPTPIAFAEGRCVGGGTEINSAVMQRTPPALLDQWAGKYHCDGLNATALEPFYQRVWQMTEAAVTDEPATSPTHLMLKGADLLKWKSIRLERARRPMSQSLLPAAVGKGLRLIADTRVHKLTFAKGRVTGAIATTRGSHVMIRANHVFVCAGAVHTPALLQRSGIKDGVGQNFRLHPTIRLTALFPDQIRVPDFQLPLAAVTEYMPALRLGASVLTPAFYAMALAEDWENKQELLAQMQHAFMVYAMIRPEGTGSVQALPFGREPFVRFRLSPRDVDLLKTGILKATELMFAAGARAVYPSLTGHTGWTRENFSPDHIAMQNANLMSIHLFGTCPLNGAAVDSFGAVRACDGLTLADASLIPEAPGVNPQATIMALALRNAEYWKGENP